MSNFKSGNFTIILDGPMAGGKTVALRKIENMLKAEGYEVKRDLDSARGVTHTLSVRWSV